MARLVYACRFDVLSDQGIDEVAEAYRKWIADKYRQRHGVSNFSFEPLHTADYQDIFANHKLSSILYEDGEIRAFKILWSLPDEGDAGLRWSNSVRVGQFGERCSVEHLIYIESVEYNISPARLPLGSPRVIRDICANTETYIGEMRVKAAPYDLQQDNLDQLLQLLESDLRKLPVVLLSPYARGEINHIDSNRLALNLAGVGVVVRIENPEITWDLGHEIGRQLSCFHGAARIYWPGFSRNSAPRDHRLFLGDWIDQVGPNVASGTIEKALFAVASFRFVPNSNIDKLVHRIETAEREQLLNAKKAAGGEFWEDYQKSLEQIEEYQKFNQELQTEIAILKANQKVLISASFTSEGVEEATEDEDFSFASVSEAVNKASEKCENIEILSSAHNAADKCPFKRPFDIYKALTDLDEIAAVWRENREKTGNGGDLLAHLSEHGWSKRSGMRISDTTRGKHGKRYTFKYKNEKQLFEPHITIGSGNPNSCASIHFILDQEREMIIIGHVGKHLPNTKT